MSSGTASKVLHIADLSVKAMYRELIKNMKFYPSKNRFQLLLAVKEEFRDNVAITDPKKIRIETRKARIGLAHILMYKDKHKEFLEVYKMKDDHTEIHFNPKDKDFIYF